MHVGWCSRNSNTVRTRTVSAALYNMFVQCGGIIHANIYRADDRPHCEFHLFHLQPLTYQ
jgi:hypothetical protein